MHNISGAKFNRRKSILILDVKQFTAFKVQGGHASFTCYGRNYFQNASTKRITLNNFKVQGGHASST
jgi:hypothetical protein